MLHDITNHPNQVESTPTKSQLTAHPLSPSNTPHHHTTSSHHSLSDNELNELSRRYSVVSQHNDPDTTSYSHYMNDANIDDIVNSSIHSTTNMDQLYTDNIRLIQQIELIRLQYHELQERYNQLQIAYDNVIINSHANNDSMQPQHNHRPSVTSIPNFSVTRRYKQLSIQSPNNCNYMNSNRTSVQQSPVSNSTSITPLSISNPKRRSLSFCSTTPINQSSSTECSNEPRSAHISYNTNTSVYNRKISLHKPLDVRDRQLHVPQSPTIVHHNGNPTSHYRRPSAIQRYQNIYKQLATDDNSDIIDVVKQYNNHTQQSQVHGSIDASAGSIEAVPFDFGLNKNSSTIHQYRNASNQNFQRHQNYSEEWECL